MADLDGRGIAERQSDERFLSWLDFDQSDIVARVGAHDFCWITRLIAEHNFNCLRAFNDVIIGEDVALCVYYKAGAGTLDGNGVHEEIVLGGLGENVGNGGRSLAIDADVDGFFVGEGSVTLGVGIRV